MNDNKDMRRTLSSPKAKHLQAQFLAEPLMDAGGAAALEHQGLKVSPFHAAATLMLVIFGGLSPEHWIGKTKSRDVEARLFIVRAPDQGGLEG